MMVLSSSNTTSPSPSQTGSQVHGPSWSRVAHWSVIRAAQTAWVAPLGQTILRKSSTASIPEGLMTIGSRNVEPFPHAMEPTTDHNALVAASSDGLATMATNSFEPGDATRTITIVRTISCMRRQAPVPNWESTRTLSMQRDQVPMAVQMCTLYLLIVVSL